MASLLLPEAGILVQTSQTDSSQLRPAPKSMGLTLTDAMIEDMIKCVQSSKPIHLHLGDAPKLTYGTKSQQLSKSQDPFHFDLIKTAFVEPILSPPIQDSTANMSKPLLPDKKNLPKSTNLLLSNFGFTQYVPVPKSSTAAQRKEMEAAAPDAALAALRSSLASEAARKQENSTEFLGGTLEPKQRKGNGTKNKSKLVATNSRSIPSSPAISGYSSPIPASQKEAEEAKIARKPVIHLLALRPMTEVALRDAVNLSRDQLKTALGKVADRNDSNAKWELKRIYWKELDVWTYNFEKSEHRQTVIDNAVRHYDKFRLPTTAPEWERLLPKEERGMGRCLSKLQVFIATGGIQRAPKINVQKPADDSTPSQEVNDPKQAKVNGDMAAKATSQASKKTAQKVRPKAGTKATTKVTTLSKKKEYKSSEVAKSDEEDEDDNNLPTTTQLKPQPKDISMAKVNGTKRARDHADQSDATPPKKMKKELLSSKTKGVVSTAKAVKTQPRKEQSTSSQTSVVRKARNDVQALPGTTAPTAPPTKSSKRSRDDDSADSSDPPLSKKAKRVAPAAQCTSDVTRNTHILSSIKNKPMAPGSPHKSSLVASSSPRNAAEVDHSGERTSSSESYHQTLTRHHKSSSSASSATSSMDGRRLTNDALLQAKKFKVFYERYEKLYRELEAAPVIDKKRLIDLTEMHERLKELKQKIYAGVVDA